MPDADLRRPSRRPRGDAGSACAELVLLTPFLVAVLGVFFFTGRLVVARLEVDDAARTALQAAVTASDGVAAGELADLTTLTALRPDGGLCSHLSTSTDTSDFVAGGTVFVRVTCEVPFAYLAFTGVPGSVTISSLRGAGLEPYREIG